MNLLEAQAINLENQPDIVVFPEGFFLLSVFGDIEKDILKKIFPDQNRPGFVVANQINFKNGSMSEIVYRNSNGQILGRQQKSFLIPGGEFMPIIVEKVLNIFSLKEQIKTFNQNRKITRSQLNIRAVDLGNIRVGSFLCSGIVNPHIAKALTQDGAEIIINSASYKLFDEHSSVIHFAELMIRFQAMAYRTPFVQATYGGSAIVVDKNGDIFKKSSANKTELLLEIIKF